MTRGPMSVIGPAPRPQLPTIARSLVQTIIATKGENAKPTDLRGESCRRRPRSPMQSDDTQSKK